MPEMLFHVRWPDGETETCYTPSLVVKDHLTAGASYALSDFLARSRTALTMASERVREKYGFSCSGGARPAFPRRGARRALSCLPGRAGRRPVLRRMKWSLL